MARSDQGGGVTAYSPSTPWQTGRSGLFRPTHRRPHCTRWQSDTLAAVPARYGSHEDQLRCGHDRRDLQWRRGRRIPDRRERYFDILEVRFPVRILTQQAACLKNSDVRSATTSSETCRRAGLTGFVCWRARQRRERKDSPTRTVTGRLRRTPGSAPSPLSSAAGPCRGCRSSAGSRSAGRMEQICWPSPWIAVRIWCSTSGSLPRRRSRPAPSPGGM
jgi:hypothetical protein